MSPKDILKSMSYCSSEEENEAQKYIRLKGFVQYQRVIEYCRISDENPSYKVVSHLYKYDKRLRDNLYIYLATVEEFLRACIGNKFEDNADELVKTRKFEKKQSQYQSVSLTLEQLTLKELNDMILRNKEVFSDLYDLSVLDTNLNALRVLRNKVGHHNFLLAENFQNCIVNGVENDSLKHNLLNLVYLLPAEFRKGFITAINTCAKGLDLLGREIII